MASAERVRGIVEPLLRARGLDLYDIEHTGGQLRVTVDRPGGVDLAAIGEATKVVSNALDEHDPIPGHYTLEVSSPGLERVLRVPAHFERAIGSPVKVKLLARAAADGERRIAGVLAETDPDGVTVRSDDGDHHIRFDEIERARTIFEWGPSPRPGKKEPVQMRERTKR